MKRTTLIDILFFVFLLCIMTIVFICGRYSVLPDGGVKNFAAYTENNSVKEIREVANKYLTAAPYSKKGLIDTLIEYEHYNADAVKSAVASMDVDWQEQTDRALESYLNLNGYSEKEVKKCMKRDGYKEKDINAAIKKSDPDWDSQAEKYIRSLQNFDMSNAQIRGMLIARGFTEKQTDKACEAVLVDS